MGRKDVVRCQATFVAMPGAAKASGPLLFTLQPPKFFANLHFFIGMIAGAQVGGTQFDLYFAKAFSFTSTRSYHNVCSEYYLTIIVVFTSYL